MKYSSEAGKRMDKKIMSCSTSLMSNAKWRKLFIGLQGAVSGVKWKFINDERIFTAPIPSETDLLEDSFGDVMPCPYGAYKEIDWILIPATYADPQSDEKRPLPEKKNKLELIKKELQRLGNFPLEQSAEGIKVMGYKW